MWHNAALGAAGTIFGWVQAMNRTVLLGQERIAIWYLSKQLQF
jgi:hypothetical protein